MVANQIPEVFRRTGGGGGGEANGRCSTTASASAPAPERKVEEQRPWVPLPGSCHMVLDVPDALLTEILRTQAHAAQQRVHGPKGTGEQVPYDIRTTMVVRHVPASGGEPERVCDLMMFITVDASGKVTYEGTYGLFRFVMSTVLEKHVERLAAQAAEAED